MTAAERVLVTIHDAIPVASFRGLVALAKKLRRPGDSAVYIRQVDSLPGPVFELYVEVAA